jgi:hypothetical protein
MSQTEDFTQPVEPQDQFDVRFNPHTLDEKGVQGTVRIRLACEKLARLIDQECKLSYEQGHAQERLEEVMFWANAAIARRGSKG